jgi:hypothetical protein
MLVYCLGGHWDINEGGPIDCIIFDFEFVGDGFGFVGKNDGGCF